MLTEQGDGTPDKTDLLRLINEAEDNQQPLTSPSKMVALHLARGNSQFREKLKSKLSNEDLHDKMEAYTDGIKNNGIAVTGTSSSSNGIGIGIGSPNVIGTSNNTSVTTSGGVLNSSVFSDSGLMLGLGGEGDDGLLNLVNSNDASPATGITKHPKMRRKRKFGGSDGSNSEGVGGGGSSSSAGGGFNGSHLDSSPPITGNDSSNSYLFSGSPSEYDMLHQFKSESSSSGSGKRGEQGDGGSLIKRRKKMELHLNINDPNGNTNKRGRPVKGSDKNNTVSGNVITDMGPPGDTPSKLTKLRKGKNNNNNNNNNNSNNNNNEMMSLYGGNGPYNTQMNSLGLGGVALESPFGSVLLSSAGFPITDLNFPLSCTADTPAKLMQFIETNESCNGWF